MYLLFAMIAVAPSVPDGRRYRFCFQTVFQFLYPVLLPQYGNKNVIA